jgi:hypothetical protein
MTTFLIVLTMLSLALAATSALIAWRLVQEERRRSDARVEALAAGVHGDPLPPAGDLFGSPPAGVPRRGAMAMAALAAAVLVTGAALVGGAGSDENAAPLELVALDHHRTAEGLVVSGVVRNPSGRSGAGAVTAVVHVFDAGGALIRTLQTAVDGGTLGSGAEGRFSVTVPEGDRVQRYRVGFRSGRRTVAHIDLRG